MNVLIAAAHPDDEALGCGGTIARHCAAGDKVHVVYFTDGVGARNATKYEVEERRRCAERAAKALGGLVQTFLDFPDNALDTVGVLQLAKALEKLKLDPEIVYTHWAHDLNVDHRMVYQAVRTAYRMGPRLIRCFEVQSSSEWSDEAFRPNCFIDVKAQLDIKIAALKAYQSELRYPPHPRSLPSIWALMQWRGAAAGMDYAEAFLTVWERVN